VTRGGGLVAYTAPLSLYPHPPPAFIFLHDLPPTALTVRACTLWQAAAAP
jgi:hypothetical protein